MPSKTRVRYEADWNRTAVSRAVFLARVHEAGLDHRRNLPWRYLDDAYAVLVSEVMLQQTQVARVERFWRRFLETFPTLDALASAGVSDVLEMWQGLGYNRRAIALKRTADECAARYGGCLPCTYEELVSLPGIGPATAAGVMAFAYGAPGVYLETNVRSVFLHELFPEQAAVPDRLLEAYVADTCPGLGKGESARSALGGRAKLSLLEGAASPDGSLAQGPSADPLDNPRDWYYALLDYGAHLKATLANPSRRSKHYSRQSRFEGSRRQKRAWIVRRVLAAPEGVGVAEVLRDLNEHERACGRDDVPEALFASIADALVDEGFFRREGDILLPA